MREHSTMGTYDEEEICCGPSGLLVKEFMDT